MTLLPLGRHQVHLDFHTSPHIPDVAQDFDADRFAQTLADADIDSVTCFARCHHGHVYYPSAAFPDLVHPHLRRPNLLGEQIEACHKHTIRVPVYITVQWDQLQAARHREWIMVDADGSDMGGKPMEAGFYHFLDVFHPGYRAFLFDMVRDLVDNVPAVDGLFFDITQSRFSYAHHWLDAMKKASLDVHDPGDRDAFGRKVMDDWKLEMTQFIRGLDGCSSDTTIFYNSGHVGPADRSAREAFTHFELESLPSGGWGYMHFPTAARYARTLGKPILGMTGKFHTSWGDFGSLKNQPALDYECGQMIAHGAVCSVGDQLHPSGRLDLATYKLIGQTYHHVKQLEPWWADTQAVVEAAVLTPEGMASLSTELGAQGGKLPESVAAANRMLQELGLQFDIVSDEADFTPYKLLIIPEGVPLGGALAEQITAYIGQGGHVILIAPGVPTDASGEELLGEAFGIDVIGPAAVVPEFVRLGGSFARSLEPSAYVMYERGMDLRVHKGADVLAPSEPAYFERNFEHFCSHRHAPSTGQRGHPAVVMSPSGKCLTFAHPLFGLYFTYAPRWCKAMLQDALDRLLPNRLVRHDGPSSLLCVLGRDDDNHRHVLHLLHYVPERRGTAFDTIEDVLPLHDLHFDLGIAQVDKVRLVPEDVALDFTTEQGRVKFTLPRLNGRAVIELS